MKNLHSSIHLSFHSSKRAYITITVLILMLVLVAITYLFADAIYSELANARNNKAAQAAFSLAEAGIQEAIYRVQYHTLTRNTFLNSTDNDIPPFSQNPALISNGAYSVSFQNTEEGVATIISTGTYATGSKTAKREIRTTIAEATIDQPYDEGIFTHSTNAGEATGDVELDEAIIRIFGSGMSSGRDIKINESDIQTEESIKYARTPDVDDSSVKCNCLIDDDGDPLTLQCSDAPQCTLTANSSPGGMPEIDFANYKEQAQTSSQYFNNPQDFLDLVSAGTTTFNGVVYVDGSLKIEAGQTVTINGILLAQSITVGKNSGSTFSTLNITDPGIDSPSGVAVENDFIVNPKGNFTGVGVVYALIKTKFEGPSSNAINLTGGILSRRIYVTNRILTIHFDGDVIADAIGTFAPVIEINHWEEEY